MKIVKIALACLAVVMLILAGLGLYYLVVPMTAAFGDGLTAPGAPAGPQTENGFLPKLIDVRNTCSRLDEDLLELVIGGEPPTSGVYDFDGANSLTLETDGTYVAWWSMLGIDAVIVKGGGEANGYRYAAVQEDHAAEWFQDSLLHAPLDEPGGEPFEVAEIHFCYDLEEEGLGRIAIAKESAQPGGSDDFDFQASSTLGSFELEPGEERVFNGVPADAAYAFTETVSSNWTLVGIECVETGEAVEDNNSLAAIEEQKTTVYLDPGEQITCTFTNDPEMGQLMVVKALDPADDPGTFDLKVDGEVEEAGASHGDATPMLDVTAGEHTVGESASAGTNLDYYDVAYRCVKEADLEKVQLANGVDELNTLFVDPGDVITCTITNTRKTGDVVIVKETDRETATKFDFASSVAPPSFSLGDGESKLFEDLPVGDTATFTETVPDGWQLSDIDCPGDETSLLAVMDPSVDIEPQADEVITCTFQNVAVPFIRVDKTAAPVSLVEPGGQVKYTVKVTSLGTTGPVTLIDLNDDIYGDLTDDTNQDIDDSTCELAVTINAGSPYQCSFKATVEGVAGDSVKDIVTARVKDGSQVEAEASNDATVRIVAEPPDTGAGLPVPTAVGALALAGMALTTAGAALRRRRFVE